jgi:fatty-acyl-CoA synthase
MTEAQQSYVHGADSRPLLGETLGAAFDRIARRHADRPALIVRSQDVDWSYAELAARVDAFAAGLLALGLQPGDRVGIWSLNNAEWVVTQFATAKAGLILVNINPAYRLTELQYALCRVGCAALITATAFKTSDYIGLLGTLLPELAASTPGRLRAAAVPGLHTVIQIGGPPAPGCIPSPRSPRRAPPPNAPGWRSWPARCSSTTPSTSSSPAAPPAAPRAPPSPTTTSSTTASSSARRCA